MKNVEIIRRLNQTVADAVQFFKSTDETLCDVDQSVREVISHLVFWHREYVAILQVLGQGCPPDLRETPLYKLNALSTLEFAEVSVPQLADQFNEFQRDLDLTAHGLPDWDIDFPIKQGVHFRSIKDTLLMFESHIRNHITCSHRAAHRVG